MDAKNAALPLLREVRESKNLSRSTLARKTGVSANLIMRIETGHRTGVRLDTALKLARGLNVPVEALIDGKLPEKSHLRELLDTATKDAKGVLARKKSVTPEARVLLEGQIALSAAVGKLIGEE